MHRHLLGKLGQLAAILLRRNAKFCQSKAKFDVLGTVGPSAAIIALGHQQAGLFPALQGVYMSAHVPRQLANEHESHLGAYAPVTWGRGRYSIVCKPLTR